MTTSFKIPLFENQTYKCPNYQCIPRNRLIITVLFVGFEGLVGVTTKITTVWVVTLYSLVD
jgi:hypothetical protein